MMMMMMMKTAALILVALFANADAFVAPAGTITGRVDTEMYKQTKSPPPLPEIQDISYGEESRRYRRTVYTHDDWVKHRSPDRFIRNIRAITASGVYKNLAKEVLATTSVATAIVAYNCAVGGYTDFEGVKHAAMVSSPFLPLFVLPLAPFTLSSPSLGLLLVFRTNTSYQRWDEARKNWGMNINHTRDLVRLASAYYDRTGQSSETIKEDLQRVSYATWAFVRSMKRHLSPEWEDEEDFAKELKDKLPAKQAEGILAAAHRPNRALQDLSFAIEALPMHFMRKNEVHRAATIFEDNLGSSERLLTSPVPLFYSRHTARFLSVWLLLLPFGLWDAFGNTWNHAAMIPATAAISIFLFGIEELATQLEEPFTILPMQAFCDKIFNWCNEIVSWEPNDNGMFDDEPGEPVVAAAAPPAPIEEEEEVVEEVVVKETEEPVLALATAGEGITSSSDFADPDADTPSKRRGLRRLFRRD